MSTQATQDIHITTEQGEHIIEHRVTLSHIGTWLGKGLSDMIHAPLASLFYGSLMALIVSMTYFTFQNQPLVLFKVATFFIMLTPFLATGLYAISAQLHHKEEVSLLQSMFIWRRNLKEFALFALALGVIIAIWSRIIPLIGGVIASNSLMIVDPNAGVMGFLMSQTGQSFMIALMTGAIIVSAIVFSITVVTIPLLLRDTNIGVIQAMILSVKTVLDNKLVMFAWALIIGALLTVGMLTLGGAMIIVMPLLGYASWHAFCDLIEVDDNHTNDDFLTE